MRNMLVNEESKESVLDLYILSSKLYQWNSGKTKRRKSWKKLFKRFIIIYHKEIVSYLWGEENGCIKIYLLLFCKWIKREGIYGDLMNFY